MRKCWQTTVDEQKQRRVRARIGTHFLALARSGDDKRPTPGNLGRLCLVGEASTCSMSADACGLRIRGEWFSAGSTREGAGDRRGSTRLKALFFVTHAFQHFRRTRIFAIGGGASSAAATSSSAPLTELFQAVSAYPGEGNARNGDKYLSWAWASSRIPPLQCAVVCRGGASMSARKPGACPWSPRRRLRTSSRGAPVYMLRDEKSLLRSPNAAVSFSAGP
jgi:hypothetical protein